MAWGGLGGTDWWKCLRWCVCACVFRKAQFMSFSMQAIEYNRTRFNLILLHLLLLHLFCYSTLTRACVGGYNSYLSVCLSVWETIRMDAYWDSQITSRKDEDSWNKQHKPKLIVNWCGMGVGALFVDTFNILLSSEHTQWQEFSK